MDSSPIGYASAEPEFFRLRIVASSGWILLLAPLIVNYATSIYLLSWLQPLTLLSDMISGLFSLSSWMRFMSLEVVCFLYLLVTVRSLITLDEMPPHNLASFLQPFTWSRCAHSFVSAWSSLFIVYIQVAQLFEPAKMQAEPERQNDNWYFFLLLNGFLTGIHYSALFFSNKGHVLKFPVAQQSKLSQILDSLVPEILGAIRASVMLQLYMLAVYFIVLGPLMPTSIDAYLTSNEWILSFMDFLNIKLWYLLIMSSALSRFIFSLICRIHQVYLTDFHQFDLTSGAASQNSVAAALLDQRHPLLQHLAALDLHNLSSFSRDRRHEILQLSELGGHPHNWNAIFTVCMRHLQALESQFHLLLHGKESFPINFGTVHSKPGIAPGVPKVVESKNFMIKQRFIDSSLGRYLLDKKEHDMSVPFLNIQRDVWIVTFLANMACASLTEDRYGIVQKSLPKMLEMFFNLSESLEKMGKFSNGMVRSGSSVYVNFHKNRQRLKALAVQSVYHIVVTFGNLLNCLSLSADHQRKLKSFLDFKE